MQDGVSIRFISSVHESHFKCQAMEDLYDENRNPMFLSYLELLKLFAITLTEEVNLKFNWRVNESLAYLMDCWK